MTDGLVATYGGRMLLVGIWAFLGLVGTTALTLLVMVRKGLPLTTQTNRVTGVREHGVGRWWLTAACFLLLPQLLIMLGLSGVHLVSLLASWVMANWWIVPVVLALVVVAVAGWWLVRSDARRERVERQRFAALPDVTPDTVVMPSPAPAGEMWTMPEVPGNWASREVER